MKRIMMSFKSQKLFFALLLSLPNLSYSKTIADAASCQKVGDCPYFFDVVSGDKEFKKKIDDFMKLPETINESWIPEGTASPSLPIILNDLTYVLFSTCQPHNCGSNSYVLAYQLKTNKLMGLHIDADNKKTPVNSPSEDEIKLMIDFHDNKIGDTQEKLPIKYTANEINAKNTENKSNVESISQPLGWYKTTAKPSLVVRSAPNISSKKLGNIPVDGKVNVLEHTDKKDFIGGYEGHWVKIQWKDDIGYSFSAFIEPLADQSTDSESETSNTPSSENINENINENSIQPESKTENADATAQPMPEDVKNILAQLFVGESLFDKGKYSQIQIEALFDQHVKDKEVLVSGEIKNIGKNFSGEKYITIKVKDNHFFDVYPAEDFNVLDYNKGQTASFVGRWTKIGTGVMISHVIKYAIKIN